MGAWLTKLPESRPAQHAAHRARDAGLRVCGRRLEPVGGRDALMLDRFDREWNPDANAYRRRGLVSGLTVTGAEDGHLGRERWSYPMQADEQEDARALIDGMLDVVRGWRDFFIQRGVEQHSVEMLEQAMLPASFFRDAPPDSV